VSSKLSRGDHVRKMLIDREKMLVLPFRKTRFEAGLEKPLDFNQRTLGP
jgi:hypothetical protein